MLEFSPFKAARGDPQGSLRLIPDTVVSEKCARLRFWVAMRTTKCKVATVIYGELHRRAAAHIRRERNNHTLSPTDLLHDVFLQLARQHVEWANRGNSMARRPR